MNLRVAGGDLNRADDILRLHGAHRHHQGTAERASGRGCDTGFVHGNISRLLNVPDGHTRLDQSLLKRERATNHKCHQVVAPQVRDVGGGLGQLPIAPDVIFGHVSANIDISSQRLERRYARLSQRNNRTRLSVLMAETQEVSRIRFRKNHHVTLHIATGKPARVRRKHAATDGLTNSQHLFRAVECPTGFWSQNLCR